MTQLNVNDARCEALFASELQRSDIPTADATTEAISCTVRRFGGVRGCAARMAQEFGDHPEEARDRMQWARQVVAEVFAPRQQEWDNGYLDNLFKYDRELTTSPAGAK